MLMQSVYLQAVGQEGVWGRQEPTGLPLPTLSWLGSALCTLPPDFTPHHHVEKLLQRRRCVLSLRPSLYM